MSAGSTTYRLVDESIVAQAFAMRRQQYEPVPIRDEPLVENASGYGSVLRDPETGLFRMWYLGGPGYKEFYATSEDGIHWNLPDLGILPEDEYGRKNAFLGVDQFDENGHWLAGSTGPEGFCVLDSEITPHPAAKERYTVLYLAASSGAPGKGGHGGLCIAHSADGLHWTADEHNPVVPGWMDTSNCMIWDPEAGKYLIYGRPPVRVTVVKEANRYVTRMESDDMTHWSPSRTVLNTDEYDADPWDQIDEGALSGHDVESIRGKNKQFYGMTVFKVDKLYLGIVQMYDVPSGHCWMELVHSDDGIDWKREPNREPFMPVRPGRWDSGMVLPAVNSSPIRVGDDLRIYHGGMDSLHRKVEGERKRSVGCRTLPVDRWVGYHSADVEAELMTHALPAGKQLSLNAAVKENGFLKVFLTDAWGKEIPGYTLDDATPVTGDAISYEIRWGDRTELPQDAGDIRIHVRSRNASVWAFTM